VLNIVYLVTLEERIKLVIPKDSVGKPDLLPVFGRLSYLKKIAQYLSAPFRGKIDYVAAPEAAGWVLGAAVAAELDIGFIGIRKCGHLPYDLDKVARVSYTDYSGVEKTIEISRSALKPKNKILIVDDWVETGAAVNAVTGLVKEFDCEVIGIATIHFDRTPDFDKWREAGIILRQILTAKD
jgi:adenine phosphoribosyltransferase